jgi:hypothetical protein
MTFGLIALVALLPVVVAGVSLLLSSATPNGKPIVPSSISR